MPTQAKTYTGTYRVANPRGIEKGIRILCTDDREWYEGDGIDPADLGGQLQGTRTAGGDHNGRRGRDRLAEAALPSGAKVNSVAPEQPADGLDGLAQLVDGRWFETGLGYSRVTGPDGQLDPSRRQLSQ